MLRNKVLLFFLAFLLIPGKLFADSPSLERMIGEMIMVGFRGMSLASDAPILSALKSGKVGGVILFSRDSGAGRERNVNSMSQLQALTAQLRRAAGRPILIAVDQEGGKVQRLGPNHGFPAWPTALELGRGNPDLTFQKARQMGALLAQAGFNLNLAPSADLHFADSPAIGKLERAFGAEPELVAAHAANFIRAMSENKILSCLKHFPGHGSARGDTHDGLTNAGPDWTPKELAPFAILLEGGFSGAIMAAHVVLPQYGPLPADLNPAIINGLLRSDLGWQGVVISDDLQMKAIRNYYTLSETILLAVEAGVDILIFGNNATPSATGNFAEYDEQIAVNVHAELLELVRAGRVSQERIRQSWERIQIFKRSAEFGGI